MISAAIEAMAKKIDYLFIALVSLQFEAVLLVFQKLRKYRFNVRFRNLWEGEYLSSVIHLVTHVIAPRVSLSQLFGAPQWGQYRKLLSIGLPHFWQFFLSSSVRDMGKGLSPGPSGEETKPQRSHIKSGWPRLMGMRGMKKRLR